VVIRPRADTDIEELADYIAGDSPRAALRFYEATRATFHFLASMPEIGEACLFREPAHANLRMWPVKGFKKYIIFYRPVSDGVEIVRVIHAARDFEAIFGPENG
jgi:toxin ParE1/3/4